MCNNNATDSYINRHRCSVSAKVKEAQDNLIDWTQQTEDLSNREKKHLKIQFQPTCLKLQDDSKNVSLKIMFYTSNGNGTLINVGQGMKVLLGIWGDELNRSSLHFVAIDSQLSPSSVSELDCYLAPRSRVSWDSTLLVATIQWLGLWVQAKKFLGFYSEILWRFSKTMI